MQKLRVVAIVLTVMLLTTIIGRAALADVSDPSPASGHAEVVAQGVADLDEGESRWQVSKKTADPAGDPVDLAGPGFAIAEKGTVLLGTQSGGELRLAHGESGFLAPDDPTAATALGDDAATIRTIRLASASAGEDNAFSAPGGRHDLDLVRDVLETKEHSKIANGELPAAIFVSAGAITVKNANGGTIELTAGKSGTLTGPLTVTATDTSTSVFYIAVIGPELDAVQIQPTSESTATTSSDDPASSAITIATYLCPAGVSVASAAPDTCGDNSGLGSGSFSLSGGSLESPMAALVDHGLWVWHDLEAGDYAVSIDAYPAGYSNYAIDLNDHASHTTDLIDVSLPAATRVELSVYFVDPVDNGGTATLGLTFWDCAAGATVDEIQSGQGSCENVDGPFAVTLTGDQLTQPQTADTLVAVDPRPSMAGDWQWLGLPTGNYTLTIEPQADGDTYYVVRSCGDQSCPQVSGLGTGIDFEIDDGGFVLQVYRIPAQG